MKNKGRSEVKSITVHVPVSTVSGIAGVQLTVHDREGSKLQLDPRSDGSMLVNFTVKGSTHDMLHCVVVPVSNIAGIQYEPVLIER